MTPFLSAVSLAMDSVLKPYMQEQLDTEIKQLKLINRWEVVDEIREYAKLTNRHWKRKRELEKSIAYSMKYWLKELEEMRKNDVSEMSVLTRLRIQR